MSAPAPRRRSARLGRAIARAALVATSLLLGFAILELGLRGLERSQQQAQRQRTGWAIYDADLGYRPRPGFDDHNADGLRDDPVGEKTRFRILMLGDSVTMYGDDIRDTYVGRLESELGADATLTPLEVINAGIRGYTNYQELVYLRKFGIQFEPDLVGVGFVLNDLHRILHRFTVEDGEVVGEEYAFADDAIESVDSPIYRLARRSHLLVWLRRRLAIFDRLVELYSRDGFVFDYRPDFSNAWKPEPWQAVREQLAEMVRLGEAHGFQVFLVAFPFGEQLRSDYLARDRDYVMAPQARLRAICDSLGIPFLDLFPSLERDEHFEADRIHLTASGRTVAAREIADFLRERALIPPRDAAP